MKVDITSKAQREITEAQWRRTEANYPMLTAFKDPIPVKAESESKAEQHVSGTFRQL